MAYFTQDYLNFLTELEKNNNRDWFNDHKKRFKDNVEAPFKAFLQDLIDAASAADTRISITPKENVFFAKIKVNESDFWRIKIGQKVKLQLILFLDSIEQ